MKYVYVVTRIVLGSSEGMVDIPNLGIHTSKKSATSHFLSVCHDRTGPDGRGDPKILYAIRDREDHRSEDRMSVISEMCVQYERFKSKITETIRLEKWPLK